MAALGTYAYPSTQSQSRFNYDGIARHDNLIQKWLVCHRLGAKRVRASPRRGIPSSFASVACYSIPSHT
eukprot:934194-Amphidinium_carterae.1